MNVIVRICVAILAMMGGTLADNEEVGGVLVDGNGCPLSFLMGGILDVEMIQAVEFLAKHLDCDGCDITLNAQEERERAVEVQSTFAGRACVRLTAKNPIRGPFSMGHETMLEEDVIFLLNSLAFSRCTMDVEQSICISEPGRVECELRTINIGFSGGAGGLQYAFEVLPTDSLACDNQFPGGVLTCENSFITDGVQCEHTGGMTERFV